MKHKSVKATDISLRFESRSLYLSTITKSHHISKQEMPDRLQLTCKLSIIGSSAQK